MQDNPYLDINELLDGAYDNYEDLEFISFEDDGLRIKVYQIEENEYKEIIVSYETCLKWLGKTKE